MTRAYHRAVRLTVWRPRPSAQSLVGAFFEVANPNAVIIDSLRDGLRVEWDVAKGIGSTPNTCKLRVTNLAERTRAEFEDLPRKVVFEIGFDGRYEHMFSGDLRWAASHTDGAHWLTEIEIADGGRAYKEARISKSFGPGAVALDAIRDVVDAMGLSLPREVEQEPALRRQFAAGIAIAGRASDELSRLLEPFGLGWSIQDGELQVLAAGAAHGDQILVIDHDAGLIGSPSYAPPASAVGRKAAKGTGGKPVMTLKCLTYPQIRVGGLIRARARNVDATFKVLKVNHRGDSAGEADTEIEAVER